MSAPKWWVRPCPAGAIRLCIPVFVVLLGAAPFARADGGAVPVVSSKAPRATVGIPIKTALAVSGGTAPYRFEVVAGSLPAGLTLARDGALTGTAAEGGSFSFTVRVTDSGTVPTNVVQSYVMHVDEGLDPALSASAVELVTQQASSVRRFAMAQIGNVQTRLQALRADAWRCADSAAPITPVIAPGSSDDLLPYQPPRSDQSLSMPLERCRTLADRATTLWTAGAVNVMSTRTGAGVNTTRLDSQGLTVGGDFNALSNFSFGASVGLAGEMSSATGGASGAFASSLSGYLSYRPAEQVYLDAVFGVGDVALESMRTGPGGEAYGTRRAEQQFVSFSAGHRIASGDWAVTPYTRVDHVRARMRATTEAGGDPLSYSGERAPSLKLAAGATAQTALSTRVGTLIPHTSLEYVREMERTDATFVRYADDPDSPYYAVMPGGMERDSTTVGLGANLITESRWRFGLSGTVNRSTASGWSRIDAMIGRVF